MIKRILISFLLMAGLSQAEEDPGVMAKRISDAFRTHEHLFNASEGRDIVAFLGNTGAGKSTLVNILAGIRVKASGPDYVLADPTDRRAMAIGEGGDSKTVYPQYVDVEGTRYFDLPGFNDTDGSDQNLVNAAFIHQILTKARTIRPVFVVGEDEFTSQRGESIKRLFTSIQRLTEETFLKEGLLIVKKSASGNSFGTLPEYVEYLLKKVNSERRPEFTERMNGWVRGNRLRYISRPGEGLEGQRDHV